MSLILFNASWMLYNIALGLIGTILGWLMYKNRPIFYRILFGTVWILFVPNSIYMLTDIIHLYNDLVRVDFPFQLLLVLEYFFLMVIAVILFIISILPFELLLYKTLHKKHKLLIFAIITAINFIVAFGMVLGRILRLNSWDVVTNLPGVINNSLQVFKRSDLLFLTIFFGILCNIVYFSYKLFHFHKTKK